MAAEWPQGFILISSAIWSTIRTMNNFKPKNEVRRILQHESTSNHLYSDWDQQVIYVTSVFYSFKRPSSAGVHSFNVSIQLHTLYIVELDRKIIDNDTK
jgi:hypothetical protein